MQIAREAMPRISEHRLMRSNPGACGIEINRFGTIKGTSKLRTSVASLSCINYLFMPMTRLAL